MARQRKAAEPIAKYLTEEQRKETVEQMFAEMKEAARNLDFERAAQLRDVIAQLQSVD